MQFVTHRDNQMAVRVLEQLTKRGCKTLLLWTTCQAPINSLALFDLKSGYDDKGRCSTNFRSASHRLLEDAPAWACKSVYLVGIRKLPLQASQLEEALNRLIDLSNVDPTTMNLREKAPWGAVPRKEDNRRLYDQWEDDRVGELRAMLEAASAH